MLQIDGNKELAYARGVLSYFPAALLGEKQESHFVASTQACGDQYSQIEMLAMSDEEAALQWMAMGVDKPGKSLEELQQIEMEEHVNR